MWSQNVFTERLGLEWPIIQAPMAGKCTPSLAAAVTSAGGLGSLALWGLSADGVANRVSEFRQQSNGGLNANYPLWDDPGDLNLAGMDMREQLQALYDAQGLGPVPTPQPSAGNVTNDHLQMLIEIKPAVVSFHFGLPERDVVDALKSAGIFLLSSATTVAEAKHLEAGGIDAVIAQGTEAGGHRGTFSGTDISMQPGLFALLPQVVDAVKIPVIAAGGIADGRGIAAALMLGAHAVQLGTAFLRCDEANVSEAFEAALGQADDSSTLVTAAVSGRPARLVRNKHIDELLELSAPPVAFPAQLDLTAPLRASGTQDTMSLYSGQSVGLTRKMSAPDLVQTLVQETTERLSTFER